MSFEGGAFSNSAGLRQGVVHAHTLGGGSGAEPCGRNSVAIRSDNECVDPQAWTFPSDIPFVGVQSCGGRAPPSTATWRSATWMPSWASPSPCALSTARCAFQPSSVAVHNVRPGAVVCESADGRRALDSAHIARCKFHDVVQADCGRTGLVSHVALLIPDTGLFTLIRTRRWT